MNCSVPVAGEEIGTLLKENRDGSWRRRIIRGSMPVVVGAA